MRLQWAARFVLAQPTLHLRQATQVLWTKRCVSAQILGRPGAKGHPVTCLEAVYATAHVTEMSAPSRTDASVPWLEGRLHAYKSANTPPRSVLSSAPTLICNI